MTDAEGKVTDSQVIVYAGGVDAAQKVVDTAKKREFTLRKLRFWHPFNIDKFNPNEAQGRVLVAGIDFVGLGGARGLGGSGRFAAVAPEALDACVDAKKLEDRV